MKRNYILLIIGLLLIAISVWGIIQAQAGLKIISLESDDPPVTIIMPSSVSTPTRPTVLIAHGLAGSSVVMRGFAFTLAHAGYTTVSWDFNGHGKNPHPLDFDSGSDALLANATSALNLAESTGLIDPTRVAILGHSMGSGVAMDYGVNFPDTFATVAVSPVVKAVTPDLPHNLLLMAGSREQQFVDNAAHLLDEAGGSGGVLADGTARQMLVVPNVEHVSILFSPTAHKNALAWLDGAFGIHPSVVNYTDRRMVWFGIGVIGSVLIATGILNTIPTINTKQVLYNKNWLSILAIFSGSIASTLILWLVNLAGLQVNQVFGLLVGGFMLLWFGIAGGIGLIILRPKFTRPTSREILKGAIAFAILWLGVGLLGNFIWLPWLLIPERLILWIPASVLLFPWFYLLGNAIGPATPAKYFGWWLLQSIAILIGLFVAIMLNPQLSFISLLLPLVPIMIGLHMLVISPRHGSWAFGISGAMYISWIILAVFPIY